VGLAKSGNLDQTTDQGNMEYCTVRYRVHH
jgi:hypothetical protein